MFAVPCHVIASAICDRLAGFHDPVGGAENLLRAPPRQLAAVEPALHEVEALCLAGKIEQRAQDVGDTLGPGLRDVAGGLRAITHVARGRVTQQHVRHLVKPGLVIQQIQRADANRPTNGIPQGVPKQLLEGLLRDIERRHRKRCIPLRHDQLRHEVLTLGLLELLTPTEN